MIDRQVTKKYEIILPKTVFVELYLGGKNRETHYNISLDRDHAVISSDLPEDIFEVVQMCDRQYVEKDLLFELYKTFDDKPRRIVLLKWLIEYHLDFVESIQSKIPLDELIIAKYRLGLDVTPQLNQIDFSSLSDDALLLILFDSYLDKIEKEKIAKLPLESIVFIVSQTLMGELSNSAMSFFEYQILYPDKVMSALLQYNDFLSLVVLNEKNGINHYELFIESFLEDHFEEANKGNPHLPGTIALSLLLLDRLDMLPLPILLKTVLEQPHIYLNLELEDDLIQSFAKMVLLLKENKYDKVLRSLTELIEKNDKKNLSESQTMCVLALLFSDKKLAEKAATSKTSVSDFSIFALSRSMNKNEFNLFLSNVLDSKESFFDERLTKALSEYLGNKNDQSKNKNPLDSYFEESLNFELEDLENLFKMLKVKIFEKDDYVYLIKEFVSSKDLSEFFSKNLVFKDPLLNRRFKEARELYPKDIMFSLRRIKAVANIHGAEYTQLVFELERYHFSDEYDSNTFYDITSELLMTIYHSSDYNDFLHLLDLILLEDYILIKGIAEEFMTKNFMGTANYDFARTLKPLLKDPEWKVREMGLYGIRDLFKNTGDLRAIPLIIEEIYDSNEALSEMDFSVTIEWIFKGTKNEIRATNILKRYLFDPEVNNRMAWIICDLFKNSEKKLKFFESLIPLLGEDNEIVLNGVTTLIGCLLRRTKDENVIKIVSKLLERKSFFIYSCVAYIIGELFYHTYSKKGLTLLKDIFNRTNKLVYEYKRSGKLLLFFGDIYENIAFAVREIFENSNDKEALDFLAEILSKVPSDKKDIINQIKEYIATVKGTEV